MDEILQWHHSKKVDIFESLSSVKAARVSVSSMSACQPYQRVRERAFAFSHLPSAV